MVVGMEKRPASPAEMKRMEALVDQAMREGALGVSSSLQYIPNIYSETSELVALAKVAARYGGAYFTHQRSESGRLSALSAAFHRAWRSSSSAGAFCVSKLFCIGEMTPLARP